MSPGVLRRICGRTQCIDLDDIRTDVPPEEMRDPVRVLISVLVKDLLERGGLCLHIAVSGEPRRVHVWGAVVSREAKGTTVEDVEEAGWRWLEYVPFPAAVAPEVFERLRRMAGVHQAGDEGVIRLQQEGRTRWAILTVVSDEEIQLTVAGDHSGPPGRDHTPPTTAGDES